MYFKIRPCKGASKNRGSQCTDCECSKFVEGPGENVTEVSVEPLEDLLGCLGKQTIDFWSLDVEGVESNILEKFPFKEIEVGMVVVEMNKSEENNNAIEKRLLSEGFKECGRTNLDRLYANPSYFKHRGLSTPETC